MLLGRVLCRRECARTDVVHVRAGGVTDDLSQIGVLLDEALDLSRRRSPAMSCQTSTWASQSGPAPIPTVGMVSSAVTCLAKSPGTISSTTLKAPASSTA